MMRAILRGVLGVGVAAIIMLLGASSSSALDENGCLNCHSKDDLKTTTKGGIKVSLFVDKKVLDTSAHRYIDCTTCHTAKPHQVETPLTKLSLAEKCGTCHAYEYKQHTESVHGEQLRLGNMDVATCVDCHSANGTPHGVIQVLRYDAPSYPKNIAETCARCHGNPELMARYGIVEKVYESYMRTFHGRAIQLGTYELGQLDKATCVNCHGTHNIKRHDDPASPVAGMDNLARTCEQCHEGAGVNMAKGFLGHKETSPEHFPVVFTLERFFIIFTQLVLAFGVFLVALELLRWLLGPRHHKVGEHPSSGADITDIDGADIRLEGGDHGSDRDNAPRNR